MKTVTLGIFVDGNTAYARTATVMGSMDTKGSLIRLMVDQGKIILHRPKDGVVELARKMLDTIETPK